MLQCNNVPVTQISDANHFVCCKTCFFNTSILGDNAKIQKHRLTVRKSTLKKHLLKTL